MLFSLRTNAADIISGQAQALLQTQAPSVAEGIAGILKAAVQKRVPSGTFAQFLPHPITITVMQREKITGTVVTMQAPASDIDAWKESLRTRSAPAVIRTQNFLNQNSRTDVIAGTQDETVTINGWTVTPIGASGSALRFWIASLGERVILSDREELLTDAAKLMNRSGGQQAPATIESSTSIPWALRLFSDTFPFLARDMENAVDLIAGPEARDLYWKATEAAGTVDIDLFVVPY